MKEIILGVIATILVIAIGIVLCNAITTKDNIEHHIYDHSGACPDCGETLVKGIYGQYTPQVCWYCPTCD